MKGKKRAEFCQSGESGGVVLVKTLFQIITHKSGGAPLYRCLSVISLKANRIRTINAMYFPNSLHIIEKNHFCSRYSCANFRSTGARYQNFFRNCILIEIESQ